MPDVHSKAIRHISHSKVTLDLTVDMTDGSSHTYSGVSREEYYNLLNAPSVGQYFNLHIRGVYPVK